MIGGIYINGIRVGTFTSYGNARPYAAHASDLAKPVTPISISFAPPASAKPVVGGGADERGETQRSYGSASRRPGRDR